MNEARSRETLQAIVRFLRQDPGRADEICLICFEPCFESQGPGRAIAQWAPQAGEHARLARQILRAAVDDRRARLSVDGIGSRRFDVRTRRTDDRLGLSYAMSFLADEQHRGDGDDGDDEEGDGGDEGGGSISADVQDATPLARPAAASPRTGSRRMSRKLAGAVLVAAISVAGAVGSILGQGIAYRQMRAIEEIAQRCGGSAR